MSSEGGVITIIVLAGLMFGYGALTLYFNRKNKIRTEDDSKQSMLTVEETF